MNILFLTSNQQPKGGWSVVGYNIIKNLPNCAVEVFSSEEKKVLGFGFKKLKSELYGKFKYLTILMDVLNIMISKKNKPDLIYCNVEYYAPVAMILSKIYNIPYTITAHGTYGVVLPTKYKLYKKAFENAYKVITVSNFTKKRMIEENIKANYEVILNGVDKTIFKPDDNITKENIITFVGNLKSRKGLKFLLESMIEVNKIISNIKVVVIGNIDFESDKYKEIDKYIQQNNLNVEFVGKISQEELIKYYQKAKLNILPSKTDPFYFEGFGLVHVEANACGTLSIGTKGSGNEDAILDGNGYLIEYGDINNLSKHIVDTFLGDYHSSNIDNLSDWKEVSLQYYNIFKSALTKCNKNRL